MTAVIDRRLKVAGEQGRIDVLVNNAGILDDSSSGLGV